VTVTAAAIQRLQDQLFSHQGNPGHTNCRRHWEERLTPTNFSTMSTFTARFFDYPTSLDDHGSSNVSRLFDCHSFGFTKEPPMNATW